MRLTINPSEVYINNLGHGEIIPTYVITGRDIPICVPAGAGILSSDQSRTMFKFEGDERVHVLGTPEFEELMDCFDGYVNENNANLKIIKRNPKVDPALVEAQITLTENETALLFEGLRTDLAGNVNPNYAEVNRRALERLANLTPTAITRNVRCLTGVAGSGKTSTFVDIVAKDPTKYFIVVPYSDLKSELCSKPGLSGVPISTMVSAMSLQHFDRTLILDEVFSLSPGQVAYFLSCYPDIIVTGDPKQNSYHDEGNLFHGYTVNEMFGDVPYTLPVSYSVPLDVVRHLRTECQSSIKTRSHVINSVTAKPLALIESNDGTVSIERAITFSKTAKTYLSNKDVNTKTVAQLQGYRAKHVDLVITGTCGALTRMPSQKYVAVTRHTESMTQYQGVAAFDIKPFDLKSKLGAIHPKILEGSLGLQQASGAVFRKCRSANSPLKKLTGVLL